MMAWRSCSCTVVAVAVAVQQYSQEHPAPSLCPTAEASLSEFARVASIHASTTTALPSRRPFAEEGTVAVSSNVPYCPCRSDKTRDDQSRYESITSTPLVRVSRLLYAAQP